ncbi:sulfurtransferase TusA family protein [Alphaproteobacteria bacterium]|nr:sulfurtransferase TusA family protein [Alphaproteobacteria bacterium]
MDKNIIKEIDLLDEVCPMTFVKTKLAIEQINQGERIKVIFNSQEAKINVPKSLSEVNHKIITIKNIDKEQFYIIIEK